MARDALDRLAQLDSEQLDRLAELADALEDSDHAGAVADIGRKHRDRSVTRRDLMQAGGALGAGAILGGAATGAASADASTSDGDPDVGTPGTPVDVFAEGIDANSVSTDALSNSLTQRPEWSTGDLTIDVPGDVSGSELWRELPVRNRHRIEVQLSEDGVDVYVPPVWHYSRNPETDSSDDSRVGLKLLGDSTDRTAVTPRSLWVDGQKGYRAQAEYLSFSGANPWDVSNPGGVMVRGCDEFGLAFCEFTGGTDGVYAYSSTVELNDVDFGAGVLSGDAVIPKHEGTIFEQKAAATPTSGNVGGYAYTPQGGEIVVQGNSSTLSGTSGYLGSSGELSGQLRDPERNLIWNGYWFEWGQVNHADPGTGDGTWDGFTSNPQSVTFDAPFNNAPAVFLQSDTPFGRAEPDARAADGFTSQYRNYAAGDSAAPNVFWMAIGE